MAGLPHYRNAKAAMNLFEPVYQNLFEITVTPPAGITGWDQLVIDNVKKVGGLDVEKTPALVEQIYKGAKRRFSAAFPDDTAVTLTVDFEVNLNDQNSMYVYKALRAWCDLIFDPLTGAMTLKKNYVGGPMVVSVHNRKGDIFRQYTFPVIWPASAITSLELDYSTGATIWSVTMSFAADYWNDSSI